jgi:hypothetical protein
MKTTKEQINKIELLRKEGKKYKEIAEILGIDINKARYWADSNLRKNMIVSSRKWLLNKPIEQRRVIYNKRKEYFKKYIRERYHNDEQFREKHKERCRKSKSMKGGSEINGNNTNL